MQANKNTPSRCIPALARGLVAGNKGTREVKVESNDYYDGLSNHYYLFQQDWQGMVSKERSAFENAFFGENVKRVLDPSCGSGEQSMALAGLGLNVVSTDPSGGLVAKCAENAERLGYKDQVTALQSDFLNLTKDLEGPFDAIVTKGSSLPHLHTDADLLRALQNFFTLLRPGGLVNIGVRDYDYFIQQKTRVYPRQVKVGCEDEQIIFDVWEWHKGSEGQQLVDFNTFHINGDPKDGPGYKTSKYTTTFRALFRNEMERLLTEAGFTEIKVTKVNGWLWENVYVARKPI